MKNIYLFAVGLCLLASGCVTVNYLGEQLTPTSKVDVYYSEHDVTKQFRVIGHLSCPNAGTDYVKEKLSAYAQKIGADAVVIKGTEHSGDDINGIVDAEALKYN